MNGRAAGGKGTAKLSRGALKRLKQKQKARAASEVPSTTESEGERESDVEVGATRQVRSRMTLTDLQSIASTMTVEDFLGDAPGEAGDPNFAAFTKVFQHFQEGPGDELPKVDDGPSKGQVYYSDDEDEDEETVARRRDRELADEGLTRRERRRAAKLSVAELKQLVDRPEVVEWFDTDARDPRLLVTLKSYRK